MALHFTKEVTTNNDNQEKKEFELITPGRYETTLTSEWKKTKAGDAYIGLTFQIRKDFTQAFCGRLVFDGIYKSKTTNEYSDNKINALLAAIPNSPSDFEDYDDFIFFINNKNLSVEITIEKADQTRPESKDRNIIKYLSYKPASDGYEDATDEDLPW